MAQLLCATLIEYFIDFDALRPMVQQFFTFGYLAGIAVNSLNI